MRRSVVSMAGAATLAACATATGGAPDLALKSGEPEKPVFLLAQIAGKSAAELDAALGAPDLLRVEGEGEFRRYTLARCALIIVLYPDDSGEKRAASIDASALKSGDAKPDLENCLAGGRPQDA